MIISPHVSSVHLKLSLLFSGPIGDMEFKQGRRIPVGFRSIIALDERAAELVALVSGWNKHWPGLGSRGNGSSSTNGTKLDDKLIGIGH